MQKLELVHADEGPLGTIYLDLKPRSVPYMHPAQVSTRSIFIFSLEGYEYA